MVSNANDPEISRVWGRLNNLQRTAITAGVNLGMSANAIIDVLSAAPETAIRRSTALAAIRERLGTVGSGASLKNVIPTFLPSESLFKPLAYPQNRNFRVWAQVSGFDPNIGSTRNYNVVVTFDQLITREQIDTLILNTLSMVGPNSGQNLQLDSIDYTTLEMRA